MYAFFSSKSYCYQDKTPHMCACMCRTSNCPRYHRLLGLRRRIYIPASKLLEGKLRAKDSACLRFLFKLIPNASILSLDDNQIDRKPDI
jgi:hypothetical protein